MLCESVASYELVYYIKNKPITNNGQMKDTLDEDGNKIKD